LFLRFVRLFNFPALTVTSTKQTVNLLQNLLNPLASESRAYGRSTVCVVNFYDRCVDARHVSSGVFKLQMDDGDQPLRFWSFILICGARYNE